MRPNRILTESRKLWVIDIYVSSNSSNIIHLSKSKEKNEDLDIQKCNKKANDKCKYYN